MMAAVILNEIQHYGKELIHINPNIIRCNEIFGVFSLIPPFILFVFLSFFAKSQFSCIILCGGNDDDDDVDIWAALNC